MTLKEIHLICWGLFAAFLVAPMSVVVTAHYRAGQPLLQSPEVDFVYLYSMGRILNEYPVSSLYDYELEKRVCSEIHPLASGEYGPIPYPPYIGILFRPLAHLPFQRAYLLWMSISMALYLGGLALVTSRFFAGDGLRQSLAFCLALSFYPFINWTLLSGHISTIGFLCFAWAMREHDLGRPFRSGLALAGCAYKPTLLVLFVPMLIVSRRFRTLAGLAAGAIGAALASTAVEGTGVWRGYFSMLASYGAGAAAVRSHSFKQLWKYVDLGSMLSSTRGSTVLWLLLLAAACWPAFQLARAWWKMGGAERPASSLVWAATLTWTLVLNIYVPVYDTILVVISAIATAGILEKLPDARVRKGFAAICFVTVACSWVAMGLAERTGVQIFTLLFATGGVWQLLALRCMERSVKG